MMTFNVTRDAMITLDGRRADLNDLKPGFMARVQTSAAGAGGTTTSGTGTSGTGAGSRDKDARDKGARDKGTTDKGTTDKDSRDRGGIGKEGGTTGRMMTVVRIEAFSRSADKGGRGGTGDAQPWRVRAPGRRWRRVASYRGPCLGS